MIIPVVVRILREHKTDQGYRSGDFLVSKIKKILDSSCEEFMTKDDSIKKSISRWSKGESLPKRGSKYYPVLKSLGIIDLELQCKELNNIDKSKNILLFLKEKFDVDFDYEEICRSMEERSDVNAPESINVNPFNFLRVFSEINQNEIDAKNGEEEGLSYDKNRPEVMSQLMKKFYDHFDSKDQEKLRQRQLKSFDGKEFCVFNLLPQGVIPDMPVILSPHDSMEAVNMPFVSDIDPKELFSVDDANTRALFREALINKGGAKQKRIDDNPTFRLQRLDQNTGKLDIGISSYVKTLMSCDIHQYQFAAFYKHGANPEVNFYSRPFVDLWINSLKNILLNNDFSKLHASLGGSCCIFLRNNNSGKDIYELLIANRSVESNALNERHVLPSFMYQPKGMEPDNYSYQLEFRNHVLNEFAEEVFKEDFDKHRRAHPDVYNFGYRHSVHVANLELMLEDGRAHFELLGLVLDGFRLRPEVISILVIDDGQWLNDVINSGDADNWGNWEINGAIIPVPVKNKTAINGYLTSMCAPGAAAMIKGLEWFRKNRPDYC